MSLAATLPAHLRPRREKVFGDGRPRALDRNAKVRIMHLARALIAPDGEGQALTARSPPRPLPSSRRCCGASTTPAAAFASRPMRRSPKRAGCARSTVAEAIKALEEAGILSWVNRITRIRERCADLFGHFGHPLARHPHQQRLPLHRSQGRGFPWFFF